MGWFPIVAVGAATLVKAGAEYRAGQAQAATAEYSAQMSRYEAQYQQKRAASEEKQHRRDVARFIGMQTTRAAAGGATGQGVDINMLLDTLTQSELDAALIRYEGELGSWRASSQAELYSAQAKEAKIKSFLDVGSTLLGGAATVGSMYGGYSSAKSGTKFTPSRYRWSPRTASGLSTTRWSPRRY